MMPKFQNQKTRTIDIGGLPGYSHSQGWYIKPSKLVEMRRYESYAFDVEGDSIKNPEFDCQCVYGFLKKIMPGIGRLKISDVEFTGASVLKRAGFSDDQKWVCYSADDVTFASVPYCRLETTFWGAPEKIFWQISESKEVSEMVAQRLRTEADAQLRKAAEEKAFIENAKFRVVMNGTGYDEYQYAADLQDAWEYKMCSAYYKLNMQWLKAIWLEEKTNDGWKAASIKFNGENCMKPFEEISNLKEIERFFRRKENGYVGFLYATADAVSNFDYEKYMAIGKPYYSSL